MTDIRTIAVHVDFFLVGEQPFVHHSIAEIAAFLRDVQRATEISISTDDVTEDLE